jgi:hypothetical protein
VGAQFTCISSTKVQILTLAESALTEAREALGRREEMLAQQVLGLLALLVQKYKY